MFYPIKVYKLLFIYSCFTSRSRSDKSLSSALSDLQLNMNNNVEVQTYGNNNYFTNVKVFDNHWFIIYVYNPIIDVSKDFINTLNIFYIMMNCRLANLTQFQLFKFIKRFPLLKQSNTKTNNIFITEINDHVKELNFIAKQIRRFISILQYFLSITSSYYDTSLLKIFLSLQFKIHFLTLFQHKAGLSEVDISDDIIIYIIFEIINWIQSFTRTNCLTQDYQEGKYSNEREKYYGYHMINYLQYKYDNEFLNVIEAFNIKPVSHCYEEIFLLKDISINTSKDSILNEISSALIVHKKTKTISIKNIFDRIQESFDLELILWYQKSIYKTIMKLLCSKALTELEALGNVLIFPDYIIESFVTINTLILPEIKQNLPLDFTYCFEHLADKQSNKSDEIDNCIRIIRDYHDITTDIVLLSDVVDATITNDFVINHKIHSSLQNFVEKINEYSVSFECFNNLYKFLHTEYDKKYYIPFQNNPTKIDNLVNNDYKLSIVKRYRLEIVRNFWESNDECNYVNKLHNLCIEVEILLIIIANSSKSEKKNIKNDKIINYQLLIKNTFTLINRWSISIISQYDENSDRDILKVAYNLYVLLKSKDHFNRYNLRPLLYSIMTHLNDYTNEHCYPPNFNYLFFGQIDFISQIVIEKSKKQLNIFIKQFNLNYPNNLNIDHYTFLDILYFYDQHVKNAIMFTPYEKTFEFYWKGEKKNINQIFENIKAIVLNPTHIYAFYDIYFKFVITMIYFEMTIFVEGLNSHHKIGEKIDSLAYTNFRVLFECTNEDNFPEQLSEFLIEIRKIFTSIDNYVNFNLTILSDLKLKSKTLLGVNTGSPANIGDENSEKMEKETVKENDTILKINKMITKFENWSSKFGVFINRQNLQIKDNSLKNKIFNFTNCIFNKKKKENLTKEYCTSIKKVTEMFNNYLIYV